MIKQGKAKANRLLSNSLVSLLMILFVCAISAVAQTAPSTDRDTPTPFAANEVKGEGTDDKTEYFYSFTAGPGEVTVTFDVKADKGANLHGFDYELFDAKSRRLVGGFLDPVRGESKLKIEKINVRGQQQLLLRLVVTEYVDTYRIRLGGAVSGGESAMTTAHSMAISPSIEALPAKTQTGNRMCLPTAGTLVIILADGTEEQIDLSQVKSAKIRSE